ncbi:MAG: CcoQ/FixQ family Cbb3-type cytochrome c oxidase assembly chaperone [Cyclobacteriaceae bacterium]
MLKFIKHHMETITGIEIFPLISFVIFFAFFLIMIAWLVFSNKEEMRKASQLPLDTNQTEQ